MARSLLSLRLGYLALFVLFASALSMSACIIPVAPNFQDPPSVPASGPYLASSDPVDGRTVVFTPPVYTFKVLVTDQNVSEKLNVRWVWDYPPAVSTTFILQSDQSEISAGPNGQPLNQDITCASVHNANGSHPVELVVTDGQFADTSTVDNLERKFDSLINPDNSHIQRASWMIVMSCMATTAPTTGSP